MKISMIKEDTPETQTRVIPKVCKTPKSDIRVEIPCTHNYNNTPITNRVNHVTTLKNAPKMFPVEVIEK